MNELMNRMEKSFKTQFPKGYISISKGAGLSGDMITVRLGLIGDLKDVSNRIRHNDPMHHVITMFIDGDNIEADCALGELMVNPDAGSYMAMKGLKTGFRKTKGDQTKIQKAFDRFTVKLRGLVDANKDNIYDAELYKNYL